MNGMQKKKQLRDQAKLFTEDGVPRDARDWLEADWRDLHEAIEWATKRIAARHAAKPRIGGYGDEGSGHCVG